MERIVAALFALILGGPAAFRASAPMPGGGAIWAREFEAHFGVPLFAKGVAVNDYAPGENAQPATEYGVKKLFGQSEGAAVLVDDCSDCLGLISGVQNHVGFFVLPERRVWFISPTPSCGTYKDTSRHGYPSCRRLAVVLRLQSGDDGEPDRNHALGNIDPNIRAQVANGRNALQVEGPKNKDQAQRSDRQTANRNPIWLLLGALLLLVGGWVGWRGVDRDHLPFVIHAVGALALLYAGLYLIVMNLG